jgi:hypothetical protein
MRAKSVVALATALAFILSVSAVLAMQASPGGLGLPSHRIADDRQAVKSAGESEAVKSVGEPALGEPEGVKFVGERGAEAVKDPSAMIDIALASVEIGPQAERCGSEPVAKDTLKAIVRQYVALNRANVKTQQVGQDDPLLVMACVYPNDFYPGQAVLSVVVPLRLSQPIVIPVSEDCVRRVNEAIAAEQPIPPDCKPTAPPSVAPEVLLIPVSLAEVGQ